MKTANTPFSPFKSAHLLQPGMRRTYRKRILETIASIGFVVSIGYALILWFVYSNLYSSLTDCVYALAYLWCFYWIKQGKYSLSTYWLIFWASVQVTVGSIFFVGPETGFQLYFLILPVMIYLLLARQPWWAITGIMLVGGLAFIASHTLHVETFRAPISASLAQSIFIINALIVFAVIFFAVKFFADEIEHAYREQEKLVQTDSLTGLFNDRFILQHASKLLSLCDRYGHPMSVLRLNIDGFHAFNRAHGIAAGKQALKHIASLLASDVRDADILARTGLDDFVILLPETLMDDALITAKRLRERVHNHPLQIDKQLLPLTVSVGVSYCESNSMVDMQQLINCAELAMQEARSQGGDQISRQIA